MSSLTYYVAIFTGLIIAGIFIFPDKYMTTWTTLVGNETDVGIYANPVIGATNIIKDAFTGPGGLYLLGLLIVGGAGSLFVANQLLGGGFALLFAIPLMIVFSFMQIFLLPTTIILNETTLPFQFKVVYIMLIGGLTILTLVTFTSGRS
jgi:hypothetical protein